MHEGRELIKLLAQKRLIMLSNIIESVVFHTVILLTSRRALLLTNSALRGDLSCPTPLDTSAQFIAFQINTETMTIVWRAPSTLTTSLIMRLTQIRKRIADAHNSSFESPSETSHK